MLNEKRFLATFRGHNTRTKYIHCIFITLSTNNDLSHKTTFGSQKIKSSENDLKYPNCNSIKLLGILV